MYALNSYKKEVLLLDKGNFENLALRIFHFQSQNNPIYKQYLRLSGNNYKSIRNLNEISFLPIEFFKNNTIHSGQWTTEKTFLSSGTTGTSRSKHDVEDLGFYLNIASNIYEKNYNRIEETVFLALLPSYIEQGDSSLVAMLNHFISKSKFNYSGFYLNDYENLIEKINLLQSKNIPTVLFGVTYALLDLAENYEVDFSGITIIETGGMKGRRQELSKEEIHNILSENLNVKNIHSEYGMTELFSQAYALNDGIFNPPDSMKIIIRDINDPYNQVKTGKSGGVNIIDLANVHSCSFIETKDVGVKLENGQFKILGRFDNSDIRGCNLLVN